ncbi:hypothetical protein QBC32DRAFT_259153 [Pseudoneurospora amorphoporcata]|uniref:Rhodopsin domain-containing protein n=1 Tax=Pseudoneurospora amorphoporcata TaxID=241081 RepID=A0AAN6SGY1_9PEZI|nr:hypothetical protein QBC32DRAFT_259153 [Pseudoneurospora amorphoporcata]
MEAPNPAEMTHLFGTKYFEPKHTTKVHLIINTCLVGLTLAVIGMRMFARFLSGAKLWWDDWLILAAVPQGIGMLIIQGLWIGMGVGYPFTETYMNLVPLLKLLISYELIFATCITTVKLSVMFFYLRVFVNHGLRTATKLAMTFVGLWSTGNVLQVFLICRPFRATYDPMSAPDAVCGSQKASFIAIGAFNVVTDLVILTLPLPTVWGLKMNWSTKAGLTGVFLVGLLTSVVAIIRIVTLTDLDMTNLTGTMVYADFWSTVEPNLAILCVSMPMLSPLWARCTTRRGASKLAPTTSDGTATFGGTKNSGFNKLKNNSHLAEEEDHIGLESLYASNKEVHYQSAVAASGEKDYSNNHNRLASRDDGSEVALTPEPGSFKDPGVITVQTKWTISVDQTH